MSDSNHAVLPHKEGRVDAVNGSAASGQHPTVSRSPNGIPAQPESRSRSNDRDGSSDSADSEGEDEETFHDAEDTRHSSRSTPVRPPVEAKGKDKCAAQEVSNEPPISAPTASSHENPMTVHKEINDNHNPDQTSSSNRQVDENSVQETMPAANGETASAKMIETPTSAGLNRGASIKSNNSQRNSFPAIKRARNKSEPQVAEWSHQQLAPQKVDSDEEEEVEWQAMPAIDEFDVFNDDGKLVARGTKEMEHDDENVYEYMAGTGKGYTRVLLDDDAKSATSLDDDTDYLFRKPQLNDDKTKDEDEDDDLEEDPRDVLGQLQATKELLTEGQRIAYVGVVRLTIFKMLRALDSVERTRGTKKELLKALENMEMWGQQMMVRLYKHMDIDTAEQLMIEQLAEHGLEPADLAPPLMQNAKVRNPMAESGTTTPNMDESSRRSSTSQATTAIDPNIKEVKDGEEVPEVHGVEDMPQTAQIDLDIRWTVLCDLFLVLISDSVYDARSRRLLERVGSIMEISWIQICRFEKRVIDQLEMQETARENWDESEHMEERRKKGLKRKYMVMGLATVGGGLVIGLSAGLLAPMIGAGLAAGFTTIGVTGTAGFLGGIGGAALITSAATAAGGTIAVRASHRRTGHVQTFEYRPLHNNKRLNLILSVSGWMAGKVDDVRLPFSTVDPIMGDIYSLLWEPEMLQSMGETINILATEALTQTVQQVLGSTILVALMAAIQVPVVLTKLAYLIDNPWTVSLDRANMAGLILADSLMARHLGQRPITLVGFSLGSRVIFSCLKELANRNAYGIIQNVYVFGSPIVAKKDEWLRARSVIAGRFVNGYASNDWILGYLFRATSGGIMRVAGLASVDNVPGLENLDVTELVNGHMAYRAAMPKLLRKLKWEVESDEFTEIEDPDPDNHAKRQRELIQEIDEARKKAEEKPQKRRFGLFRRGKLAEKQNWEKYQFDAKKSPSIGSEGGDSFDTGNVLFDIDAIRKELISEQIEIRELDSTQPPMQFKTVKDGTEQTEYLRLPPGISLEEVAQMKLPPRPDEIDDGPPTAPPKRDSIQRTKSTPAPSQATPVQTPKKFDNTYNEHQFDQPKELVSTLPPLRLTPHVGSVSPNPNGSSGSRTPDRPELKKHGTEPTGMVTTSMAGLTVSGAGTGDHFTSPELDHNAWAEDGGEVQMTFE